MKIDVDNKNMKAYTKSKSYTYYVIHISVYTKGATDEQITSYTK